MLKRKSVLGLNRIQGLDRGLWYPDLKYHLVVGAQLGRVTVMVVVALLFDLGSRQGLAALFPIRPQRSNTRHVRCTGNPGSDLGWEAYC